jgi:hypothetical protein
MIHRRSPSRKAAEVLSCVNTFSALNINSEYDFFSSSEPQDFVLSLFCRRGNPA